MINISRTIGNFFATLCDPRPAEQRQARQLRIAQKRPETGSNVSLSASRLSQDDWDEINKLAEPLDSNPLSSQEAEEAFGNIERQLPLMKKPAMPGEMLKKIARSLGSRGFDKEHQDRALDLLGKHLPGTSSKVRAEVLSNLTKGLLTGIENARPYTIFADEELQKKVVGLVETNFPQAFSEFELQFHGRTVVRNLSSALGDPNVTTSLHDRLIKFLDKNLYSTCMDRESREYVIRDVQWVQKSGRFTGTLPAQFQ